MVGDLFSAFVLTRTISEDKIPGQRPFSAFVLTRTISEGPEVSPAYQNGSPKDLGTKSLVPRSWYQALGTKIFGGTILVRWRDLRSLRDCPREDKR